MNSTGRVGPLPVAAPEGRGVPHPPVVSPTSPPTDARGDTVRVGSTPARSAELLAWVRSRLAEPIAGLDLSSVGVPLPAAFAALRGDPSAHAALVRTLAAAGWTDPRIEPDPDGALVLRATRAVPAAIALSAAVVVPPVTPRARVSAWIAVRVAALVDPARPLLELSLSGPDERALATLLRSDAGLRAHALAELAAAGFPRATLDDLDLPALARITLRHPERELRRPSPSPDRAVDAAPAPVSATVRSPMIGLTTGTAPRVDLPPGMALPGVVAPREGVAAARLRLAELVALASAPGALVPVPRWAWAPLVALGALGLGWLLS